MLRGSLSFTGLNWQSTPPSFRHSVQMVSHTSAARPLLDLRPLAQRTHLSRTRVTVVTNETGGRFSEERRPSSDSSPELRLCPLRKCCALAPASCGYTDGARSCLRATAKVGCAWAIWAPIVMYSMTFARPPSRNKEALW